MVDSSQNRADGSCLCLRELEQSERVAQFRPCLSCRLDVFRVLDRSKEGVGLSDDVIQVEFLPGKEA